jgi:mono/diheme cytochrome c family protein
MRVDTSLKLLLIFGSLLFLCSNALVLYKNYTIEWRPTQKEYLAMAIERADNPQVREMLEGRSPRIEQVIITKFGGQIVDRCITCHMGVDDENFKDAPQPFTTHPPLPGRHPLRVFGCTVCHGGNGRALIAKDAHGEYKHWEDEQLNGDFVQAKCAQCHTDPYNHLPQMQLGSKLYMEKACYACHKIEGVSDGKLAPDLTRVGVKFKTPYLLESIENPTANDSESIMPKMELTDDEKKAMTVYLKSQVGENLVEGSVTRIDRLAAWKAKSEPVVEVTVESGEKVFKEKACNACHTINGKGGKVGPDLSVEGLQRTKEWTKQHNIDPKSLVPGSTMPTLKYSESQLDALTLYLDSLQALTVDNSLIYGTSPATTEEIPGKIELNQEPAPETPAVAEPTTQPAPSTQPANNATQP